MKNLLISLFFLAGIVHASGQGTGNIVKAVFVDEHNVKWFGTDLGLLRFDGSSWKAYNSRYDYPGEISSIAFENSQEGPEMWVGTEKGISVARYDIDGISAATRYTTENSLLDTNRIVDIVLDSSGTRYFATPAGVGVLEVDEWSWLELGWGPPETGIPNYELLSLGAKNDTVYVGAISRGAGRIINEIDGFSGASFYERPWTSIAGNTVKSIFTDNNGYQWFGTTEGFSQHTTQNGKLGWDIVMTSDDGLINNTVNSIFQDSNGDFWMATDGGVSKFIEETLEFTNYTTSDGLAANQVFDIDQDQDNIMWFATANGVSSFDGNTFSNYSTAAEAKDFINIISIDDGIETKKFSDNVNVYPNPAESEVYIHFAKETDRYMNVAVFDISGKMMKQLYRGYAGGGDLKLKWDLNGKSGERVPGGIYFITIDTESERYTRKVVVL